MCAKCSKVILPKSRAIQCSLCVNWSHVSCTGLSISDFNRICAETRKKSSHEWTCEKCREVRVRCRASLDLNEGGRQAGSGQDRATHVDDFSASPLTTSVQPESDSSHHILSTTGDFLNSLGTKIQDKLVNKRTIDMGDLALIILQIFNAISEQNLKLTGLIAEIQQLKSSVTYEEEIVQLREEMETLKKGVQDRPNSTDATVKSNSNDNNACDVYSEIQDRNFRSKNVLFFNIPESNALDSKSRIDHDRRIVVNCFSEINIPCNNFKAFRLGKPGNNRARPVKVALSDSSLASLCLKNRGLLINSEIRIKADLTVLQRSEVKKAYEELKNRSVNEENLCVRYINGVPKVVKSNNNKKHNSKN